MIAHVRKEIKREEEKGKRQGKSVKGRERRRNKNWEIEIINRKMRKLMIEGFPWRSRNISK